MPKNPASRSKIKLTWLSFFISIFFLAALASWYTTFKFNPPTTKINDPETNITGKVQSHEYNGLAVISVGDEYYNNRGGVIAIAKDLEPSIYVRNESGNGSANVYFYRSNEDALLESLIHDDERNQINDYDIESDNFEYIGETSVDLKQYEDEKVTLPDASTGIYFAEVKSGSNISNSFIIISENGAIVKEGDDNLVFWAQNFESGKSLSNGKIELVSFLNGREVIEQVSLNSNGIAKTTLNSDVDAAILRSGDDFALIPINLKYLNSSWHWEAFEKYKTSAKYFSFTDRPIYKPGDTISFKSIIRADYDANYSIPQGSAKVVLSGGSNDSTKIEKILPISETGSIDGSFQLPADTEPGYYDIVITALNYTEESEYYWYGDNVVYFQVEEYRKPEYTLNVETKDKDILLGEDLIFTIKGNYFSGYPLAGQRVSYKIGNSDAYTPYYFDESTSPNEYLRYYGSLYDPKEEGSVILGQDGTATISVSTNAGKWDGSGGPQIFRIEANFKDATQNDVLAGANILVYPGDYQIFKRTYNYSNVVDKPLTLDLKLKKTREESSISNIRLSAEVTLSSWERKSDSSQKSGYKYEYVKTKIDTLNTTTTADGSADFTFTPSREGTYEFEVSGKDSKDRTIKKDFTIWISDREYNNNRSDYIEINPTKKVYDPGETANFTITSSVKETDVLLGIERGYLKRYQIIKISNYNGEVSLPLEEADMPNLGVTASTLAGGHFLSGYTNITVSAKSKQLNIEIKPDQKRYKPGDTVNIEITTTDINNQPISAEVAVWAMDKSLLELTGSNISNVFNAFWRERYNDTSVAHSLEGITRYGAEGGGGGGGDGDFRSLFKDTAYWNPKITTDANGKSNISFKLPDDLTTWVIQGVGATTSTVVGQTSTEIIVGKEFVIRPVLPNVLRENDRPNLSAIVNNYTSEIQTAEVSMSFDSGKIVGNEIQKIQVEPNSQSQVFWQVIPEKVTDTAKVTLSAKTESDLSDSVELKIPIEPYGYEMKHSEFGTNSKKYNFDINNKSLNDKTSVEIELASSITGSLRSSMKYLTNYPYGCVEQTVSRLIPLIVASENISAYSEYLDGKDLSKMMNVGIDKLLAQQHSDGGWGWWTHLDSDAYTTAYVVEYLQRAEKLGYAVDPYSLSMAQSYLAQKAKYTNFDKQNDYADEVPAAYAILSSPSETNYYKNDIPQFSVSYMETLSDDLLAMAVISNYKQGITDPNSNGLNLLISRAEQSESTASWSAGSSKNFGSNEASTALALKALLVTGENKELALKAVKYLVTSRTKSYWANTFATALVIDSVTRYSEIENELNPNFEYTVRVNGREINTGKVTTTTDEIPSITIPSSEIKTGNNEVEIEFNGTGQLYSTLFVNQFIKEEKTKAIDSGIKITREYINDKGPEYTLSPGDTVTVRLSLSGAKKSDISYLAIEDFLPSGLIPINTNLANQSGYFSISSAYAWEMSQSTRKNGVVLYIRNNQNAKNIYEYKARVVNSGKFYVPPAHAEFMYLPEVYGFSASDYITVTDKSEIDYVKLVKSKALQSIDILVPIIFYGIIILIIILIIKLVVRRLRKLKNRKNNKPDDKPSPEPSQSSPDKSKKDKDKSVSPSLHEDPN